MIWPFRRKPAPLDPGAINEDWAKGDLAECIADGPWIDAKTRAGMHGPEKGDVFKVVDVLPGRTPSDGDMWFLELARFPRQHYAATGFRKVPPLNSTEQTEVAERIKRAARNGSKIGAPA